MKHTKLLSLSLIFMLGCGPGADGRPSGDAVDGPRSNAQRGSETSAGTEPGTEPGTGGQTNTAGSGGVGEGPVVECAMPEGGDYMGDASAGAEGAQEQVALIFFDGGALHSVDGARCSPSDRDLSDIVPGECVDAYVCDGCPLAVFSSDDEGQRTFRMYGLASFDGGCAEWSGNYYIAEFAVPAPPSGSSGGGSCSCDHCNGITSTGGYVRCLERCEAAC